MSGARLRVPALWTWVAVGGVVDMAGLFLLRQAGLRLPLRPDAALLGQLLAVMGVAWTAHVALVPALLRTPRRRTAAEVAGAAMAAGLLAGWLHLPAMGWVTTVGGGWDVVRHGSLFPLMGAVILLPHLVLLGLDLRTANAGCTCLSAPPTPPG